MSNRADSDIADAIHRRIAEHFLDIIENGEEITVTDKETGEVSKKRVPPSAAMLAQIRTFLKDNNITVVPGKSKPMVDLGAAFSGFAPPDHSDSPDYQH